MSTSISSNDCHRRSSVASSCPSLVSSFSSSSEYSNSPSSVWSMPMQYMEHTPDYASFGSMEDITKEAFAAQQVFFQDVSAGEAVDVNLIPSALPMSNGNAPFLYEFDSIDPTHTINYTSSPPRLPVAASDFPPSVDAVEGCIEDAELYPISTPNYKEDTDVNVPDQDALYESPTKTPKPKREKGRTQDEPIATAGTFKCELEPEKCNKKFRRQEHLKRHEKTLLHQPHRDADKSSLADTDEFIVHCQFIQCNRPFNRSRRDNLKQHEKLHANGDPETGQGFPGKRVPYIPGAKEILEKQAAEEERERARAKQGRVTKAKTPRANKVSRAVLDARLSMTI